MNTTEKLGLKMPESTDAGAISALNYNAGILDTEVSARIKTINGESADEETGNYNINEVPYARQLVTEDMQRASGEVLLRSTGGGTPLTSGNYKIVSISGRMVHEGYVAEYLAWNVVSTADDPITADINRNTFVSEVDHTVTGMEFSYSSSAWHLDGTTVSLATYGITVTGTPVNNDKIVVTYVKEERGTIKVPKFTKFFSTGWNLYNHAKGYARVPKYSNTYGFKAGEYSSLQFSTTEDGEKTNLYPDSSGHFTVPSDGYVWVVGGNDTSTYVLMTWSDWIDGYPGGWSAYSESEVDLSYVMQRFPNGLLKVGDYEDEVIFSYPEGGSGTLTATAYSRVGRMDYNDTNLATAKSNYTTYNLPYEYDEDYIYYAKQAPDTYTGIAVSGEFFADDHGTEYLYAAAPATVDAPIYAVIDYPQNLVSKLRMDVATLSEQTLTDSQKAQVRTNIGAASQAEVTPLGYAFPDYSNIIDNKGTADTTLNYTATEDCYVNIFRFGTGSRTITVNGITVATSNYVTISSTKYHVVSFTTLLKKGDTIASSSTVRYLITGLKR